MDTLGSKAHWEYFLQVWSQISSFAEHHRWSGENRSKCETKKWKVTQKLLVYLHDTLAMLYIVEDKSKFLWSINVCELSREDCYFETLNPNY